jgi:hypothetical protein
VTQIIRSPITGVSLPLYISCRFKLQVNVHYLEQWFHAKVKAQVVVEKLKELLGRLI